MISSASSASTASSSISFFWCVTRSVTDGQLRTPRRLRTSEGPRYDSSSSRAPSTVSTSSAAAWRCQRTMACDLPSERLQSAAGEAAQHGSCCRRAAAALAIWSRSVASSCAVAASSSCTRASSALGSSSSTAWLTALAGGSTATAPL